MSIAETAESVIGVLALIVILYIVGEVLASVPGTAIDENPLGFIEEWLDRLEDIATEGGH